MSALASPGPRRLTVCAFRGTEPLADVLARSLGGTLVPVVVDHFPDGEARVQLGGRCTGGDAIVVWMVTVEPHLHRVVSLGQIYSIPTEVVHVSSEIAAWISRHVADGIVIGPDAESRQWVRAVADAAELPYVILQKTRISSERVEVSVPSIERWRHRTPILVDDVISTGHTMLEAARHLRDVGARSPICVAVHALFAGNAYAALLGAGFDRIVTTTTIAHESNAIDISACMATSTAAMLARPDVIGKLPIET